MSGSRVARQVTERRPARLGRHEEAVLPSRTGLRTRPPGPVDPPHRLTVGRALYFARRLEEALGSIRATAEMEAAYPLFPDLALPRAFGAGPLR